MSPFSALVAGLFASFVSAQDLTAKESEGVARAVVRTVEWRANIEFGDGDRVWCRARDAVDGEAEADVRVFGLKVGEAVLTVDGEDVADVFSAFEAAPKVSLREALKDAHGGWDDKTSKVFREMGYLALSGEAREFMARVLVGQSPTLSVEAAQQVLVVEAGRVVRCLGRPWVGESEVVVMLQQLEALDRTIGGSGETIGGLLGQVLKVSEERVPRRTKDGILHRIIAHEVVVSDGLVRGARMWPARGKYNGQVCLEVLSRRRWASLCDYWEEDTPTRNVVINEFGTVRLITLGERVRIMAGYLSGKSGIGREEFRDFCQ